MAAIDARRQRHAERAWALPLGVFFVAAATWQRLTLGSESLLIPTFTEIIGAFYDLVFVKRLIWEPLYQSNKALVFGYGIAVGVGVPIGLLMARVPWFEEVAEPYTHLFLALPTAPLIPLIMMALGLGLASRVLVVVLFSIIYITINTRAGVRNVDTTLIEMAKSFGANEVQIWRKILIPGAVPAILAGLRIGLGRAVNGMVVAELLLVATGIGNLLLEFRAALDGGMLFATVFAVSLEAIGLLALMKAAENRLAPWARGIGQE